MPVEVLASYDVGNGRRIELCHGDLADVGPEDASDLLVVSAFPGDYTQTSLSLIGQLARRGLSVGALAADKEADLRATTSCWISKHVEGGRQRYGFDRLLCYEPRTPSLAAETVGDLFRALVPYVGPTTGVATVAMPVLGSGDMARPFDEMLRAILDAARHWMAARLALERLRIVVNTPHRVARADDSFARWSTENPPAPTPAPPLRVDAKLGDAADPSAFDVFISYARADGAATAELVGAALAELRPGTRIFLDKLSIDIGVPWQRRIAESIDASKKVVVVMTPGFLVSKPCQEELNMASLKHMESTEPVLFPIYVLSCERLPLHLRVLNYFECREADQALVRAACQDLVGAL